MAPLINAVRSTLERYADTFPEWVDARSLASGVAEDYTVPTGAQYIILTSTAGVYVNTTTTAAAPADTTNGSASMWLPLEGIYRFRVKEADVISICPAATCVCTIAAYRV
jgi:hypothetical protein